MKIPNFLGLHPSPPFQDTTYTVICYLLRLWVLFPERAQCGKISGGWRKYRKGVDHIKGGSPRKGGLQSDAELCATKKNAAHIHFLLIKAKVSHPGKEA